MLLTEVDRQHLYRSKYQQADPDTLDEERVDDQYLNQGCAASEENGEWRAFGMAGADRLPVEGGPSKHAADIRDVTDLAGVTAPHPATQVLRGISRYFGDRFLFAVSSFVDPRGKL